MTYPKLPWVEFLSFIIFIHWMTAFVWELWLEFLSIRGNGSELIVIPEEHSNCYLILFLVETLSLLNVIEIIYCFVPKSLLLLGLWFIWIVNILSDFIFQWFFPKNIHFISTDRRKICLSMCEMEKATCTMLN